MPVADCISKRTFNMTKNRLIEWLLRCRGNKSEKLTNWCKKKLFFVCVARQVKKHCFNGRLELQLEKKTKWKIIIFVDRQNDKQKPANFIQTHRDVTFFYGEKKTVSTCSECGCVSLLYHGFFSLRLRVTIKTKWRWMACTKKAANKTHTSFKTKTRAREKSIQCWYIFLHALFTISISRAVYRFFSRFSFALCEKFWFRYCLR